MCACVCVVNRFGSEALALQQLSFQRDCNTHTYTHSYIFKCTLYKDKSRKRTFGLIFNPFRKAIHIFVGQTKILTRFTKGNADFLHTHVYIMTPDLHLGTPTSPSKAKLTES